MAGDNNEPKRADGSRLLKAVESVAISPDNAKHIVEQYQKQYEEEYPEWDPQEQRDAVAKKIIERYAQTSALLGGTTALTGVIPGLGTAVAIAGGTTTDMVVGIKLQVDMCMCLAETFGYDISNEDAKHLAFLIAAGASIEQAGVERAVTIGSKAGVKVLKKQLEGATLAAVKEAFKKVGVTFTRKSLENAIPFGVGTVISSGANYALTRYVGHQATDWFVIDRGDVGPSAKRVSGRAHHRA